MVTTSSNTPTTTLYGSLETLWKPSGNGLAPFRGIYDLETARKAFGLSQREWGQVLAAYLGRPRPFTGSAVSAYEYAARSSSRKVWRKYGPTSQVLQAYRQIIADGIAAASQGRVSGEARWRGRQWQIRWQTQCACGRTFTLKRVSDKRCPRCRSK